MRRDRVITVYGPSGDEAVSLAKTRVDWLALFTAGTEKDEEVLKEAAGKAIAAHTHGATCGSVSVGEVRFRWAMGYGRSSSRKRKES